MCLDTAVGMESGDLLGACYGLSIHYLSAVIQPSFDDLELGCGKLWRGEMKSTYGGISIKDGGKIFSQQSTMGFGFRMDEPACNNSKN